MVAGPEYSMFHGIPENGPSPKKKGNEHVEYWKFEHLPERISITAASESREILRAFIRQFEAGHNEKEK